MGNGEWGMGNAFLLPLYRSTYYLLPITYYLLPTTYYRFTALPIIALPLYLLPITYYLLPITYYLLPITYYLLPITHYLYMALQTDYETKFGKVENAYCRLTGIEYRMPSLNIFITLDIFLSETAAKIEQKPPVDSIQFLIPVAEARSSAENVIAFAYNYMKAADPQLESATDV